MFDLWKDRNLIAVVISQFHANVRSELATINIPMLYEYNCC